MSVGLVAALIASVIGTINGLVSGYAGSWVDDVLQRFTELVMTFPTFFAVIILVALLGPSVFNIMLVIGFMGWTGKARLVRGQVLSLRRWTMSLPGGQSEPAPGACFSSTFFPVSCLLWPWQPR